MNRAHGFTLLELLIGLTLLGFLFALLFGGFRLAADGWNSIENQTERTADEDAALAAVRRIVAQTQPIHLKDQAKQSLAFAGRSQTLRLVAPVSSVIGLRTVELSVEPDGEAAGGVSLLLRQGALTFTADQFSDSLTDQHGHLLIGDLHEARFSYFGPERRGQPPQWQDEWSNTEQFPTLVRLHLVFRNGAVLDWDTAPMATGDLVVTNRITVGPR